MRLDAMMQFEITHCGSLACSYLEQAEKICVHSIYRKTINLLADDHLLAIQIKDSPISPITLLADCSESDLAATSLQPKDLLCFDSDSMNLISSVRQPFCFSLSHAVEVPTELTSALAPERWLMVRELLETMLASDHRSLFSALLNGREPNAPGSFLLAGAVASILKASLSFIRAADDSGAANQLARLIGVGNGLTPSGDDFVCGVLAGLCLRGDLPVFREELDAAVIRNLSRTNDISGAFLDCAVRNHYSTAIQSLTQQPSLDSISRDFGAIGHSSGMDSAAGVLFALRL